MLQGECSAILSTFIKPPFVIKIFVLSIFEWQFYTGFTVCSNCKYLMTQLGHVLKCIKPIAKSIILRYFILTFSSAEMFKKPLWQTVWTQIRLLL